MNAPLRMSWRNKTSIAASDRAYVSWLRDRGSLTARLRKMGDFSIRLLQQGLAAPTLDESMAFGAPRSRLAWIREVSLHCNGQPLVFAHSVLPYRPIGPMTGWLARMENRSLGALLFAHPGFRRGALECRRLDHRHPLFRRAVSAMPTLDKIPSKLWARRSRFTFGSQSVMVTEVFSATIIGILEQGATRRK